MVAAGGLDIHDPLLAPDKSWKGVGVWHLLQSRLETVAETGGQDVLRQEELGGGRPAPAQSIGAQTGGRHDTVDMRMELELAAPGMEHAQDSQLSAEILLPAGHFLQGGGALLKQKGVSQFLVGAQPGAQRFGHRKGDQVIGNGKEFEFLPVNPLGGLGLAALRTGLGLDPRLPSANPSGWCLVVMSRCALPALTPIRRFDNP